jgi:hypothetical protein
MAVDLEPYENKLFSQNGEDGITLKLIELLYDNNHRNKYYVEFGVENGAECNTRLLRDIYSWQGLQMDGSNENEAMNLRREFITKENVVELFKKYNVPPLINILSVDIDFNDFYCLNEILKHYTCDIIICEYNATHLSDEDKVIIYDKNGGWDGSNYFGASLLALEQLGRLYNYSLIYCEKKGVNCFFIHTSLLEEKQLSFENMGNIEKLYRKAGYGYGPNGGHRTDPYDRKYITFAEALTDMYTMIDIGSSETNEKEIILPDSYPGGSVFVLNKHSYRDTFDIIFNGHTLKIKRTDVTENMGWGYPHKGFIMRPAK